MTTRSTTPSQRPEDALCAGAGPRRGGGEPRHEANTARRVVLARFAGGIILVTRATMAAQSLLGEDVYPPTRVDLRRTSAPSKNHRVISFRVQSSEFRVQSSEFRVSGERVCIHRPEWTFAGRRPRKKITA